MTKRKLLAGSLAVFVLLLTFQAFIATGHKHINLLTPLGEQSNPHDSCVICRNITEIVLYFKRVEVFTTSVILILSALVIESSYLGYIRYAQNSPTLVAQKVRLDA